MDKSHDIEGIALEEYSIGGALSGQELFPLIIVAVLSGIGSGFLSEIGKDLWETIKKKIRQRITDAQNKTAINMSPSGRKVSSIFFPTKKGNTTIIYFAHTERETAELDFDHAQLKQAESEILLLSESGKMNGVYLGIDLSNVGRGAYLWPFNEIPSRLNKDNFCLLADMETSSQQKTQLSTHYSLAAGFIEIGRLDLALKHAKITAQISPHELAPWLMLARIYDKLDDADGMLYALMKASMIDDKDPNLHRLMAEVYACKKDVAGIIRELEAAVSLGFVDAGSVLNEPNFRPFLSEPGIMQIIEKMKSNSSRGVNLDVF
ncbi:MAG: hypothetical protein PHW12_05940 [Smithella sp.]|nr:hypothetical protein [Smithella sp.]MDD5673076.1 hypothetical protein [Chitinivibrionales bacterium]